MLLPNVANTVQTAGFDSNPAKKGLQLEMPQTRYKPKREIQMHTRAKKNRM